jgi:putative protease
MKQPLPELLAPAGDRERLEAAVLYGADAVYLAGKQFGMRATPLNFAPEELAQAVEFCHARGVRVYLTCNTLPINAEADRLPQFLAEAATARVDALIVSDIGVLMAAKRAAPDIDIHISTQAGVVNYLAARELHNLGASRVILARELSLEDIATIRAKTPDSLELEAFVNGAMCMSFSGRCLISQYLTGRDGNRGQCAQPCRWKYTLMEEKRPGQFYPIYEGEDGCYLFNAWDLSTIAYVDKLAAAGISSFKIEGRAKSAYYAAVVTNAYRLALNLYAENPAAFQLPAWLAEEVDKVSHRPYSPGFYFPEIPPGQSADKGGYVRDWDVVAVAESWADGILHCTSRNRFYSGDTLELLQPGQQPVAFEVRDLRDEEGQSLPLSNHPMAALTMAYPSPVGRGAMIRRRSE